MVGGMHLLSKDDMESKLTTARLTKYIVVRIILRLCRLSLWDMRMGIGVRSNGMGV